MAKKKVDEVRDSYEVLNAEDREMDKSFRKEFSDSDSYVDQLYKLFKKRPHGQRYRILDTIDTASVAHSGSQKFFSVKSSVIGSTMTREESERGKVGVENATGVLDHISRSPLGLDVFYCLETQTFVVTTNWLQLSLFL